MLLAKHWRVENVARLLLALATSWLAAGTLAIGLAAAARDRDGAFPPVALLAITGIGFHGMGLFLIHRFLKWEHRTVAGAFGSDRDPWDAVGRAALWMLAVAPLVYGLHQVAGWLLEVWGWHPNAQQSVELLLGSGWAGRVVIALFALVLAPLAEEALFRGILFTALRDAGWPKTAYGVASLGFGIIHGNLAALVPLS
ncbi:MAG: CPBP family intramembrane metalloprotease, partial [Verrucomicrobiae bacterium]|nr:CPBP family intramembrane metalloprotease [Verrucomicrobiae bacterium]